MSTTWEDVQRDMYHEQLFSDFESEIASRKKETVKSIISDGFTESEDITYDTFSELSAVSAGGHSRSVCHLNFVLLEAIERETITVPLLIAAFGADEAGQEKLVKIKQFIQVFNVESARFTCRYFEESGEDVEKVKGHLAALIMKTSSKNAIFKSGGSLWSYREQVKSFRNYLVHAHGVAQTSDMQYVSEFSIVWRDLVINSILKSFELKLDGQWHLRDA